jgi:hypothetical protein
LKVVIPPKAGIQDEGNAYQPVRSYVTTYVEVSRWSTDKTFDYRATYDKLRSTCLLVLDPGLRRDDDFKRARYFLDPDLRRDDDFKRARYFLDPDLRRDDDFKRARYFLDPGLRRDDDIKRARYFLDPGLRGDDFQQAQ